MRKYGHGIFGHLKTYFSVTLCCALLLCCCYLLLTLTGSTVLEANLFSGSTVLHASVLSNRTNQYSNANGEDGILVDPYHYNWTVLEETFCTVLYPNLTKVTVIHSATDHFEQRIALRQMYGRHLFEQHGITILFAVGMPENKALQERLLEESRKEHDLIQQNFQDSYRNLTWKALMWLRFIDEYCPSVQYIIKLDDDVVGNIFRVLQFLHERVNVVSLLESQKQIFCRVIYHRLVEREKKNKWYVTVDEFPDEYYLNYCVGMAVVFTGDLPNVLLQAAKNERYFWIDDYFVTGILAKKANAQLVDLKRKVVVYGHEGNEHALLDGTVFFRLTSNISYGLKLWEQIEYNYFTHLMNESMRSTFPSLRNHSQRS